MNMEDMFRKGGYWSADAQLKPIAIENKISGTPNRYDSNIVGHLKGLCTMLSKNPKMRKEVISWALGIVGVSVGVGVIIGRISKKNDLDKLSDKEISEIANKIADAINEQNKSTDHHEDRDQKE